MAGNTVLICPGSAMGLFTGIYLAWQRPQEICGMELAVPPQMDMLSSYEPVAVDEAAAGQVIELLKNKLGSKPVENMAFCWLSEIPGCGQDILRYAALGLECGRRLDSLQGHPAVRAVLDKVHKVTYESHKLTGLLRFRRAGEGYYAVVEPDHNVVGMLAQHFARRMPDRGWVIEDRRRGLYAVHDHGLFFADRPPEHLLPDAHDDSEALWRGYYDTTAIAGRLNPGLQRQFMPRRYWKNLVEDPYGALAKYLREQGIMP